MADSAMANNSVEERMVQQMIERLTKTDAHFKHQQRGEPDLTLEQKSNIALDIFKKSPALFLERFSKHLTLEDIEIFAEFKDDYRVEFYLGEINKRCKDTNHNSVKNRRFSALQELMDKGEYFSEDEMKWRDPLLYEQMVGQYLNENEKMEQDDKEIDRTDLRFSTILLKHMDTQATREHFEILKEREEEQEEEEEDSDEQDSDGSEMDEEIKSKSTCQEDGEELGEGDNDDDVDGRMSEIEKKHLRNEFLRIMQERFLSGEDKEFDYSQVDSNTDYDSLDILSHDAEERYFDADEMDAARADGRRMPENDSRGDWVLRRRLGDLGLETEMDKRSCGLKEETTVRQSCDGQDKENGDAIEDYMSYVPSDDVIASSATSNDT